MHVPGRSFARPGKLQAVRGYSLAVCVNFGQAQENPFWSPLKLDRLFRTCLDSKAGMIRDESEKKYTEKFLGSLTE